MKIIYVWLGAEKEFIRITLFRCETEKFILDISFLEPNSVNDDSLQLRVEGLM